MLFKKPFSLANLWGKTSTSSATEYINAFAVVIFSAVWLLALFIFSVHYSHKGADNGFIIFSKVLIVSAAAYFCGGLTGFIFGIPKTLQNPDQATNTAATAQGQSGIQSLFLTNTSLEQISDWLTKIIVGIGLISLKSIPGHLNDLRLSLQTLFGNADTTISAYALGLAIFSTIVGFITFYIYTRVNLAAQFIKEAIDNGQLTNDVVAKADNDAQFKTDLMDRLK